MKLKKLLEGFAWERTPGQPLPTLNDVQKRHDEKLSEEPIKYNPNNYQSAMSTSNWRSMQQKLYDYERDMSKEDIEDTISNLQSHIQELVYMLNDK